MWKAIIQNKKQKNKIISKINEISESITFFPIDEIGLLNGNAGISLLYYYLDRFNGNNDHEEIANTYLIDSFQKINEGFNFPSFCAGTSGIIWTINHLIKESFIDADDFYEAILPFLMKKGLEDAANNNLDYLHGASGIALSLLDFSEEIPPSFFTELIRSIKEQGIEDEDSIKWKSTLMMDDDKIVSNLSLSHGISSFIIILCEIHEKFSEIKDLEKIITKALHFLLTSKNKNRSHSIFPSYVDEENGHQESRLAWCYGDLGNALAFYKAGKTLKREELIQESIDIMLHAANRLELEKNHVFDAGICHGTAGIAHIFNRFYQNTGEEKFKITAQYWIDQTLKQAIFEDGVAGYKTLHNRTEWRNEISILEGAAGIALVLLSSISDIEPNWDKSLLIN
jgi:lantibiotic biosynthesis protein